LQARQQRAIIFFTNPDYIDALLAGESLKPDFQDIAKIYRPEFYGHKTAGLQEMNTSKLLKGQYGALPEPDVTQLKGRGQSNQSQKGFQTVYLETVEILLLICTSQDTWQWHPSTLIG
jgi:hypothetical protein